MKTYRIILKGKPIPWTAPRVGRRRTFSTHTVKANRLKLLVRSQYREKPLLGAVMVDLSFYMPIPKSASAKRQSLIRECKELHTKRPDITNLCKITEDLLNGIVYVDDAQIVKVLSAKYYSDDPRVEIYITEI